MYTLNPLLVSVIGITAARDAIAVRGNVKQFSFGSLSLSEIPHQHRRK